VCLRVSGMEFIPMQYYRGLNGRSGKRRQAFVVDAATQDSRSIIGL